MLTIWYRLPLALKIALPMALLCFLSALTVIGITQYSQQRLLHERTDGLGAALASRLAAGAARPLVEQDAVSLQAALADFTAEPAVQRAAVFDLKQQLVAAAGAVAADTLDYSATIHWQDSAVGRAVLSLHPGVTRGYYPQFSDLLVLAAILAALGATFGVWFGHRVEALLITLTRKLSGEQVELNYRGTDALARLLYVPPPPLLSPEPEPAAPSGAILLQVYSPDESAAAGARALALAVAVSALYGGAAKISRAGGITARFAINDEFEGPFRALCCAQLLGRLGAAQGYRLALGALASADDGDVWSEQQLIERLQRCCVQASEGGAVHVDGQLQRHPALQQRSVMQAVADDMWRVTALQSPYDTLLDRQLGTLRGQLETTAPAPAPAPVAQAAAGAPEPGAAPAMPQPGRE
jgi:hypothetical protein